MGARKVSGLSALAAVSVRFVSPAAATTIHLKCFYANMQGEEVVADLALNEEKREADVWFYNTNAGSQWPAKFLEKLVTIKLDMQNLIFVDRVSLKFTRAFIRSGSDVSYEKGFCRKSVAPKRAF